MLEPRFFYNITLASDKIGWSYTQHYVGDVILDDDFEEVS